MRDEYDVEIDVDLEDNIIVEDPPAGSDMIWLPSVSEEGELSWEKSSTDTPPDPVSIKGEQGDPGTPGEDGDDGRGIKDTYINDSNHLIIVYDDDTTKDAGEIQGSGGTTVVANPAETGNEASLSGLQVGTNKFKVLEMGEVRAANTEAEKPSVVVAANDELAYKPDTTNYILLYIDDARTDLSDAWTLIQGYGIPVNLAVPSDHLSYNCKNGQKMYELLHTMENAGCEILSHACKEADILTANTTREQAYEWLKKSKEALLAKGYKVHGFCEPGGAGKVSYTERGFDDLVRMFYNYSDCNIYPTGINKARTSLYTSGVTIDSLLKSIKRGQNARKFFFHYVDGDVTETYLREFIETALSQNFVFTTEYEYYRNHAYSILDDRLKRLEVGGGKYTSFDAFLFHRGWGRPAYDASAYPYAFVLGSGDMRFYASSAPLVKDLTDTYTTLRTADSSSYKLKRWIYASGAWTLDKDTTTSSFNTNLSKSVNPSSSNYDIVDSNGATVCAVSDYYTY